ncbi:MAG: DUF2007 domain-containing protein [Edaphobacter sp.]|uniref:DUF2007 domain-containing protein n=1 Tax=Edaphobacter sp. TaxID=1934404 RepID=UPI0023A13262|nr:DUF2007 domain-containing protein [Edaphobacter sp.]MDE1175990.1 DUF2007 domain-containing protein [Edaphobacter sp.]
MSFSGFADRYRQLSDSELLAVAEDQESLLDEAKTSLADELARRGLDLTSSMTAIDADSVDYRDLVTIRRYRDLSEAIVARGVVESAGIFCFLKDENLVRLDWQMSNLIGGIRLQVGAADVDAAEAVLSQPIPETIQAAGLQIFRQPHCPRCDSVEIAWERQGRKAALISLYLFHLPMPRGSESWHCSNCGLRWVEEDDPEQATIEDDQ